MSDKKINLEITGMSCAHCKNTVENSIKDLEGVKEVNVSLNPAFADVVFDEEKINAEKIIEAVNATVVYQATKNE